MKKTSLILTLVFVLCVLVCFVLPVGADGETVVTVNGVGLTESEVASGALATVIADCKDGGTIELYRDISCPSISLGPNWDGDAAKWTINGNGYTITDSDNTERNSSSHTSFLIYISNCVVEINDLTLKTYASGIKAEDTYADITLNNVNVYASGTKPGSEITYIPTTNASSLKRYAYAIYLHGSEDRFYNQYVDNISLTVNGGEYKTAGADGSVMYIRGASVVAKGGSFIGEDCVFVAWIRNLSETTTMLAVSSSLTVYDGVFARPVSSGPAAGSNTDAANGGVIRVSHGGLLNIHGGSFINCDGTEPADGATAPSSSVITVGTGDNAGLINIYGGSFYQLSPIGSTTGEIIKHLNGYDGTKILANIYGGSFYVREGLPNANLDAVVAAKANSNVTANDNTTVQKADWADFAVVKSGEPESATVYGTNYSDLIKISFSYTGQTAPGKLQITNPSGRIYYIDDLAFAINSMAEDDATVKVLTTDNSSNGFSSSRVKVLNRNQTLNFTSAGTANNQLLTFSSSTEWYGLWIRSGNFSFGKMKIKSNSAGYSFYLGVPDNTLRPLRINLTLNDTRFARSANNILVDNGCAEGKISTTKVVVDNYNTSWSNNVTHTYPAAKPNIKFYTNLALYTDFTVNFFFPKEGNRVVDFTVDGVTTPIEDADITTRDGVEYYVFKAEGIGPTRAMKSIPFSATYTSPAGFFSYTASSSHSIVKYANSVMLDDEQPEIGKKLVRNIVGYIHAAYEHFGNVGEATDSELSALLSFTDTYPADTVDTIPSPGEIDSSPINTVVESVHYNLGGSEIRLILDIIDTSAPLKVSVDGSVLLNLPANHGMSTATVPMRAFNLTKIMTLSSGDKVATFSFAAYAERALAESSSETLPAILKAMHIYSASAKSYRQFVEVGLDTVYTIIYPSGDAHLESMASTVKNYLGQKRNINFEVVADGEGDSVTNGEYEILLGLTNRAESQAVNCPEGSFYISVTENKIILFGNDEFYSDMAILYFLENLVDKAGSETLLNIDTGYQLIKEEESSLGAYIRYRDIVSTELTYEKESKYSTRYAYSDGMLTTSSGYASGKEGVTLLYSLVQSQGAATDGEFIYLVHTNPSDDGGVGEEDEDITRIHKVDPKTHTVVATGPAICVRHGNDMVYDSKNNRLMVVWSYGSWVSVLDTDELLEDGSANPNYLGIKESFRLGGETVTYTTLIPDTENGGYTTATLAFHGVGYDEINDRYVGATSGATPDGYGMVSFKLDPETGLATVTGIIDTPDLGYTKQGADCDSYFVYHAQSYLKNVHSSRESYIVVSDWDGNYTCTLKIPYPDSGTNTIEIETLMWCDGKLYIAANRGGGLSLVRLNINYNY